MPDPQFITTADWSNLGKLLVMLWLFVLAVVVFGGAFLLAHAIIPSLLETGELGPQAVRVRKLRPLMYAVAVAALAAVAVILGIATNLAHNIVTIYDRWWY